MDLINSLNLTQIYSFAKQAGVPIIADNACKFLFEEVQKLKPKSILEIGTAIGFSGTVMLKASPHSHLTTIELKENMANIAKQNFEKMQLSSQVTLLVGDAKNELLNLNKKFDFVFLDGPKAQYLNHFLIIQNLLNIGGVVFCDNVFFKNLVNSDNPAPKKYKTIVKNLQKFINFVSNNNQFLTTFYNIDDGIAIIKKII